MADNIAGRTICAFGEACSWPTQSFVAKFRDEFAAPGQKPVPPPMPPEYTPEDLINDPKSLRRSLAHDSRLGKGGRTWNDLDEGMNDEIPRPH